MNDDPAFFRVLQRVAMDKIFYAYNRETAPRLKLAETLTRIREDAGLDPADYPFADPALFRFYINSGPAPRMRAKILEFVKEFGTAHTADCWVLLACCTGKQMIDAAAGTADPYQIMGALLNPGCDGNTLLSVRDDMRDHPLVSSALAYVFENRLVA